MYAKNKDILEPVLEFFLARGRFPEKSELNGLSEIENRFGSLNRAVGVVRQVINIEDWAQTERERVEDLLIYLGLAKFGRRSPLSQLPKDIKLDVKAFFGKSLGAMLTEIGVKKEVPDDLLALIKRDIAIAKHRESNKKDMTAKRGQQLTLSKINKLVDYYKANKVLELNWSYERSKAMQWVV